MQTFKIDKCKKVGLFSDFHLGIKQNSIQVLQHDVKFIKWFINNCKKNNVEKLIFLGDFFHSRNSVNIQTMNIAYKILKILCKEFEVFLIIGNHDIFYKEKTEVHSLKSFSDIKNLNVIENTTELIINNKHILLCPFHWDVPDNKKYDILMGHFEMSGAKMAGGLSSDKMPMKDLTNIAPLVFSGHYHIRKEYDFEKGKVITIGCPLQLDWGDYNNNKGFYTLDLNTNEYIFIHNDISPIYQKIYWSNIPKDLSKFSKNYVKLLIDCSYKFDEINDFIVLLKAAGILKVEIDFIYSITESLNSQSNNLHMKKSYTKYEYIKNYIDDMPKIENVDKNSILNLMEEYFKTAENNSNKIMSLNANEIEFLDISIQNFKSIGEKQYMTYNDYSGVWYVKGENKDNGCSVGAGKTTMISALIFALYAKDLKNTKNKFIYNRLIYDKLRTEVILKFKINNELYKVITGFNPKHPIIAMDLYKLENDKWDNISKSSVNHTKKYIETTLLKCSYELFKSSIYLCGQDYNSFFTLNKSQKRKFLEDIFNLTIFGDILQLVRNDYNKLQSDINILENEIIHDNKTIKTLNKENINFNIIKEEDIKKIKLNIKNLINNIKDLKSKINTKEIDTLKNKLNELSIDEKLYNKLKTGLDKLNKHNLQLTNQNSLYTKLNSKYTSTLKIVCKNCEDKLSTEFNINSNNIQIEKNTNLLEENNKKINKINNKIKIIKDKIKEHNKVNLQLSNILTEQKYIKKDIIRLYTEHTKMLENLENVKNKTNHLQPLLDDNLKKVKDNKQLVSEHYKKLLLLDVIQNISSEDGVKIYIINDLVQVLNKLMGKYLSQMGAEFGIIFKNNFDVEFLTTSGPCTFDNFSGGERKSIEIASLFSFKRLLWKDGIRSNITVLDEVLDAGISDTFASLFLNIIKKEFIRDCKKHKRNNTTFIISHKNFDVNEFNGVLKIVKEHGISKIKK